MKTLFTDKFLAEWLCKANQRLMSPYFGDLAEWLCKAIRHGGVGRRYALAASSKLRFARFPTYENRHLFGSGSSGLGRWNFLKYHLQNYATPAKTPPLPPSTNSGQAKPPPHATRAREGVSTPSPACLAVVAAQQREPGGDAPCGCGGRLGWGCWVNTAGVVNGILKISISLIE